MFAVSQNLIAVGGKDMVHFQALDRNSGFSLLEDLLIRTYAPRANRETSRDPFFVTCLDLSATMKYLAVGDSHKGMHLFEFDRVFRGWKHVSSWQMDKKVIKVGFAITETFITMADKTGSVWLSVIGVDNKVSDPVTILGHTSFILDFAITLDTKEIITCDRDEKIRISSFPKGCDVIEYRLGHKAAVVSVCLVHEDRYLLSLSCDGDLRLWNYRVEDDEFGYDLLLRSWDIFKLMGREKGAANEARKMRAMAKNGRILIAAVISGFQELPVFMVHPDDLQIRQIGQTRLKHDFVDLTWAQDRLWVYCPLSARMSRYSIPKIGGVMKDEGFALMLTDSVQDDLTAFGKMNHPNFPLKKNESVVVPEPQPAVPEEPAGPYTAEDFNKDMDKIMSRAGSSKYPL